MSLQTWKYEGGSRGYHRLYNAAGHEIARIWTMPGSAVYYGSASNSDEAPLPCRGDYRAARRQIEQHLAARGLTATDRAMIAAAAAAPVRKASADLCGLPLFNPTLI